MARFAATTTIVSGQATVALVGECDLTTCDELTAELAAALLAAEVVIVDAAELGFLDSSGVHSLVVSYQAAQQAGRQLYVINAAGVVAQVLELTGVGELLRPPDASAASSVH